MSFYSLSLRTAVLATTIAISSLAAPAHAFADDEARRAILDLRAQIKQITDQNQQARLQLADQLETLQHEVTTMRGELEKMQWQQDMEKRAGQDQSGGNHPQVDNAQEQAAFDQPMGLFRSGKYKEAAAAFGSFLQNYPNSQLSAEAKFYQGSSFYASKNFKGAIQELQGLVQADPKDPRAADALLVVAASQVELNSMAGAKATLQKIVKSYPNTSAADTAKSRLKLLQ
ncbi:tol-pal system protein YbgF [Paralcaligenes sp. KSB-10]|uniref:tol-pal system protein YbgF n=1 Tax=Paralcaligenes sp. KSB-10 TaxID=2901142 RepID=UPI001E4858E4|nr:tol-pal system protein YbgF [Paralcaligenes sp. KSB-10]UHL64323.1 tol-pal system protein YbgF [Paralcaligenes sp. KSB-10]